MLELNFDQQVKTEQNLNRNQHHQPQLKNSYGGGFRKWEQTKRIQGKQKQSKHKYNDQILNYVKELGIQNLPQLYSKTIPNQSNLLKQKQKQQQQQSVIRLYKNLYASRKNTEEHNAENNGQQKKQDKKYAQDLWKLDKRYQNHQPEYFIVAKELQKLHKKLKVQLQGLLKKKKIQNNVIFQDIFCYFLFQEHSNLIKAITQQVIRKDEQMQIFYVWKRFVATTNFKSVHKKYQKCKIQKDVLEKLCNSSKYIYTLVKIRNKKIQSKQNQKQQKIEFGVNELKAMVHKQFKVNVLQICNKFQILKQYSNPFMVQNLQHKDQIKQKILTKLESSDLQQLGFQFKAKPIPKSTYEPPKEKSKSRQQTVTLKPFNLTQKHEVISAQEYYQFQKMRQFKAQPVPSTIYKPFKPQLMSQQEKKARAILSLQKAHYPATMQNLQNYKQIQNTRHQQLSKKFTKIQHKPQLHDIPNFDHLHAIQVVTLERRKQNNKRQLKVQPFKLSVNKSKPIIDQNNYFKGPEIHPYYPSNSLSKPLKSTKKFDSYVSFRAEQKKNNMKKAQQQKDEQQKKRKQKQPYKETIKERMAQQLYYQNRKTHEYDASMPKRIKVDKQKIYRQKPLLMEGDKNNIQKQYYLPWEPIF